MRPAIGAGRPATAGATPRRRNVLPRPGGDPLLVERRHDLDIDVPHGLVVDGDRLTLVLSNGLNNAAKYAEPGGRIKVVGAREGGEVHLGIRAAGIGIAPDMLGKVFDLFVQGRQPLDCAQGGSGRD